MSSVFDSDFDQLTQNAQAFLDAWNELACLPLKCLGGPTLYYSSGFSVPPAGVARALIAGPLTIGLPRVGMTAEELPGAAVSTDPGVLGAGKTSFRLAVDARQLSGTPGGTYWGEVAVGADSQQPQGGGVAVPVWIVIP